MGFIWVSICVRFWFYLGLVSFGFFFELICLMYSISVLFVFDLGFMLGFIGGFIRVLFWVLFGLPLGSCCVLCGFYFCFILVSVWLLVGIHSGRIWV